MDRYDFLAMIGLGMLGTGVYLIYPPAALIVVGTILIGISLFGAQFKARQPASTRPPGKSQPPTRDLR